MRFFDHRDTVRRAREALDAAGFTLDAITDRLGPHAFAHLSRGELAPLVRATRDGDRLDTLLRLFVIGLTVPVPAARAALSPLPLEAWTSGGVLAVDGDGARALLAIRPLAEPADWLVAHDLAGPVGGLVRPDHVLGISASTMALAGTTVRRPIEAAFDLGTGCGIQALYAARHSRRVVATDLSPRAVAFATLTMELDDMTDVDVREGDRFAPVSQGADAPFDLIVANPPFVISPSRRYVFRDSELPVDEVSRSIVRTAPAYLSPGGHCQLLASWAHVRGEDWRDRLTAWFDDTGCDALVLEREVLSPEAHTASWLRQTEPPERWQAEYDEWLAYDEANGIEAIGFGLITMRKRVAGRPHVRIEEATQDFAMPCGDHLGAAFELADVLEAYPGDALLGLVLRVAPDVILDERATPSADGPGGWSVADRRLRQTAGLCHEGQVDGAIAAIVAACDGVRPVGAVLLEAAEAAEVDPSGLARGAVPILRRLVELGFLLPVAG